MTWNDLEWLLPRCLAAAGCIMSSIPRETTMRQTWDCFPTWKFRARPKMAMVPRKTRWVQSSWPTESMPTMPMRKTKAATRYTQSCKCNQWLFTPYLVGNSTQFWGSEGEPQLLAREVPTSATTQRGVMTLSRRPMHGKKGPELKPAGTRLMNIPKPSSSIHFLGFLAIIHCYRNHTGISFVFIKIRI